MEQKELLFCAWACDAKKQAGGGIGAGCSYNEALKNFPNEKTQIHV
jgi:hypothetical protein